MSEICFCPVGSFSGRYGLFDAGQDPPQTLTQPDGTVDPPEQLIRRGFRPNAALEPLLLLREVVNLDALLSQSVQQLSNRAA